MASSMGLVGYSCAVATAPEMKVANNAGSTLCLNSRMTASCASQRLGAYYTSRTECNTILAFRTGLACLIRAGI